MNYKNHCTSRLRRLIDGQYVSSGFHSHEEEFEMIVNFQFKSEASKTEEIFFLLSIVIFDRFEGILQFQGL